MASFLLAMICEFRIYPEREREREREREKERERDKIRWGISVAHTTILRANEQTTERLNWIRNNSCLKPISTPHYHILGHLRQYSKYCPTFFIDSKYVSILESRLAYLDLIRNCGRISRKTLFLFSLDR